MKLHKQQGHAALGLLGFLVLAALLVAVIWGWVGNILALVHHVGAFALLELLRVVGIFVFPLGVILGWFA